MGVKRSLDDGFFVSWRQLISVFLLTPPAALIIFYALVKIFTAEAGPQWFQAIGSVLAIVAAVWIAKAEERRRRDERKDLAVSYMEGAYLIALSAAMMLRKISNELQGIHSKYGNPLPSRLYDAQSQFLDSIMIDIQSVDIMKIMSIDFQKDFMELKRRVYLAPRLIEACIDNFTLDAVQNISDWVSGAEVAAKDMEQHIANFRGRQ